jgi:hypothetical protein
MAAVQRSLENGPHHHHPFLLPLFCYSGLTWMTKSGLKKPNYWGSITQAGTVRIGNYEGVCAAAEDSGWIL